MNQLLVRFPHSPEARASSMARRHIEEEFRHFSAAVRQCELTIRLALSSAMIATDCENERQTAENYIHDMMQDVFGAKWKRLVATYDDEGGDVSRLPWPEQVPT